MIRFRLGQSWKREGGAAPEDAFGLELDGVDVLAQAGEEALEQVVPELAEAVHSLSAGERVAQLSLPEAHLELCFLRQGAQAELRVAALSRPCRLLRKLDVDLAELREATARCARSFLQDLAERSRDRSERLRKRLERKLTALEHRPLAPPQPGQDPGFSYRAEAAGRCAFGFWLRDPQDRIRAFQTRRPGGLASLLCDGETWLRAGSHTVWTLEGPPALAAMELSRQAADLARAFEAGDRSAEVRLSGHGAALTLERVGGRFASPSHPDVEARALARAMCELGLALAFAVGSRHRPQARNPYLTDLSERCRDVLAELRESPQPDARGVARAARAASSGKPLAKAGRLRRLRLEPLWQKQNLGGDEPGQLRIGPRGPVFVSPGMACAFSPSGQLLFRHVATHGVAADGTGRVLTASADRIAGFQGKGVSARWIRDHDGVPLGPDLWSRDGLWLTL
ncbi:MAG TPA: hypothetical protein VH208_12150, partial [Myxococcaceae bacterium]|nr:hypothetical protein [Myxococcaceae bacterium]